ncbi:MAG: hypothetical protein ACREBV_05125, partial [Candidatus Zixiibacteriota bacterium]
MLLKIILNLQPVEWYKIMMNKTVLAASVFLFLTLMTNVGRCEQESLVEKFSHSHQLGARLGAWSNLGDLPPTTILNYANSSARLETKLSDANFYFEGFFGYRFNEQLMLELSMGISNRGSVTLSQFGSTEVGNVIIYPILLQMKLYLL